MSERNTFYFETKELKEDGEEGKLTGVASVYGVEDLGNDIIDKGAFTKTLQEKPEVLVLWYHDQTKVIGKGTVSEWQNKLLLKAQLDMDDPLAVLARSKIKKGLINSLSIGFKTIKATFQNVEDKVVRHIQELKLYEVSVCAIGMLPQAQINDVKQASDVQDALKHYIDLQVSALRTEIMDSIKSKVAEPPSAASEPVEDHSVDDAIRAMVEKLDASLSR